MKPVCCDTSFLFAAYAADVHTSRAVIELKALRQPITVSVLNLFEAENAFRFAYCRGILSSDQLGFLLSAVESDCHAGRLSLAPLDLADVVREARRLSGLYTASGGHRSYDILLVASALQLGAGRFLSFDSNQRKLAKVAGLRVSP